MRVFPPIYRPAALTARIDRAGGEGSGGASCARRAAHSAIGGGQDLASAASEPGVGNLTAGARPSPRAPRRAWFLTWRTSAPGTRAKSCATAQLCA